MAQLNLCWPADYFSSSVFSWLITAFFLDVESWNLDVLLSVTHPRLIFVTGTDTGVGKTVLTSLLLAHLRGQGIRALALKPFCSGSRADATLLHALMDDELTLDEVNPFYFAEPIAPLVAVRKHHRRISLKQVISHLESVLQHLESKPAEVVFPSPITHYPSRIVPRLSRSDSPTLLIEGAGGLLAPLAHNCTALDIIRRLHCEVLLVAPNKLGTINHTLLTIRTLQSNAPVLSRLPRSHASRSTKVVLMNSRLHDASASSNPRVLSELLARIPVHTFPFLGSSLSRPRVIRRHASVLHRKLAILCRKH